MKGLKTTWTGLAACLAAVSVVQAESTWLRYDNGNTYGGAGATFHGARFTLTTGVSTASLKRVQFYYNNPSVTCLVHITAANHVTELVSPITVGPTSTWRTVTIPGGGVQVPQEFFVVLEPRVTGNPVFDNSSSTGRYYLGSSLAALAPFGVAGALVLRAEVSYGPATFWTSTTTDLGNAWKSAGTFGTFAIAEDPWIYHQQHGWMYTVPDSGTSCWLGTFDLGWIWTGQSMHPWFYSAGDGTWLFYIVGSSNPRWFYNWNAGSWEARY